MCVGTTIRKLRKEKGLTQTELGRLLGVQKAAVQKWESGQVQNLKQSTIKSLCEIFDKNPAVFIFATNELLDPDRVKQELHVIEQIELLYGSKVIKLMEVFLDLSETNQDKVLDYTCDLSVIESVINRNA